MSNLILNTLNRPLPFLPLLDWRIQTEGRQLRFTSRIDADSAQFEEELLSRILGQPDAADRQTPVAGPPGLLGVRELPLQQRHVWLRHTKEEYRLFQMRDGGGRAALQVVIYVRRPRGLGRVGHAIAQRMGPAINGEEERVGLALLRQMCQREGDLLTLRLQARRVDSRALWNFEERARAAGYASCEPEGVTRTLLCELRESREAMTEAMSYSERRKMRAQARFSGELRVLDDASWAGACQEALAASVTRTGGEVRRIDWEGFFSVAREHPELLRVVGLFLPGRRDLVAFASAYRHGMVAEYASAGSLSEPELRKLPFNYWLMGCLFDWAREHGSAYLDLCGVTSGGPDDPLAGISAFKRHLADFELEVGEMYAVLQPGLTWTLNTLRKMRQRLGPT